MRYFLLIPALVLFLSNIPFVHKMDMKEMMAAVKKSGCCKKKTDSRGSCGKAEQKVASCHAAAEKEVTQSLCAAKTPQPEQPCDPDSKKCGMQDATCVCICCFQYAAPDQLSAKLQFGIAIKHNSLSGYLPQHWKDPLLTAPWQPPDVA